MPCFKIDKAEPKLGKGCKPAEYRSPCALEADSSPESSGGGQSAQRTNAGSTCDGQGQQVVS